MRALFALYTQNSSCNVAPKLRAKIMVSKQLEGSPHTPVPPACKGAMVVVELDPTVGHEQHGVRPCIVVSDPGRH